VDISGKEEAAGHGDGVLGHVMLAKGAARIGEDRRLKRAARRSCVRMAVAKIKDVCFGFGSVRCVWTAKRRSDDSLPQVRDLCIWGLCFSLREQPSGPSDSVYTSVSGNFEGCASTEVQTRADVPIGRNHHVPLDAVLSSGILGTLEKALLVIHVEALN